MAKRVEECTRFLVGYVKIEPDLYEPPAVIGPSRVIGPAHIIGTPLPRLSDPTHTSRLSDQTNLDHDMLSD